MKSIERSSPSPSQDPVKGEKPPNFIVYMIDKLRPDRLGIYGYPRKTSPHLDRLSRRGIVFDHAYAPCPWTLPSITSLLTGLVPASHGANFKSQKATLVDQVIWLPRLLEAKGYSTACFHTHPFLRKTASFIHLAFQEFHEPSGASAERFSERMYLDTLHPAYEAWLEKHTREPFFLYVHVIDVHGPYAKMRVLEEDEDELRELQRASYPFPRTPEGLLASSTPTAYPKKSLFYDGHIHWVDEHLHKLVRKLESLGIDRRSYLFITSDHGEGFGEHGYWNHGRDVFEELIRVPLIVLCHDRVKRHAGRVPHLVNTIGLLPTILDLAGVPQPEGLHGGSFKDLWSERPPLWSCSSMCDGCLAGNPLSPDSFMLDTRFKLITHKAADKSTIFDLEGDPGEVKPFAVHTADNPSHNRILRDLMAERERFLSSIQKKRIQVNSVDQETLNALEALGYL